MGWHSVSNPEVATRRSAIAPILVTFVAVTTFWIVSAQDWRILQTAWADDVLKFIVWVGLCVGVVRLLDRAPLSTAWRDLGLGKSVGHGYGFGLMATLPMALLVIFVTRTGAGPDAVIGGVLLGPFAEELLFRGFLFAQLVRSARWRVWPAILVSAAAFGLAHVPDLSTQLAGDLLRVLSGLGTETLIQRFASVLPYVTVQAAGGVLFAWVFHRWGSLWQAVGLHSCINLWWILMEGSEAVGYSGAGVGAPHVAQALAVALAIGLTLRLRPRVVQNPESSPIP